MPVRIPLTLRSRDALTARALGVIGPGALLVRPVGRPAALWVATRGPGFSATPSDRWPRQSRGAGAFGKRAPERAGRHVRLTHAGAWTSWTRPSRGDRALARARPRRRARLGHVHRRAAADAGRARRSAKHARDSLVRCGRAARAGRAGAAFRAGYEIAEPRRGARDRDRRRRARVREAFADDCVSAVIAHPLVERNASNGVFEKVGFRFDAEARSGRNRLALPAHPPASGQ